MARDPELDRRIGALRDHLLPLDQSARPQELPRDFIERAHVKLAAQDLPRALRAVAPLQAANQPSRPKNWGLGVSAATVVRIAVGFGAAGFQPVPQPTVVAVLLDAAGVPQAVIHDYGNDMATVRFVANITGPADRTLKVWTLPTQQMGPVSLGTLDKTQATQLRFQDLPSPMPNNCMR